MELDYSVLKNQNPLAAIRQIPRRGFESDLLFSRHHWSDQWAFDRILIKPHLVPEPFVVFLLA
jgi:hypothetical protein